MLFAIVHQPACVLRKESHPIYSWVLSQRGVSWQFPCFYIRKTAGANMHKIDKITPDSRPFAPCRIPGSPPCFPGGGGAARSPGASKNAKCLRFAALVLLRFWPSERPLQGQHTTPGGEGSRGCCRRTKGRLNGYGLLLP